jgi:hypothetical protein
VVVFPGLPAAALKVLSLQRSWPPNVDDDRQRDPN